MTGRATLLLASAVIALTFAATATAAWKPGAKYSITEQKMNQLLERHYDHAYCDGIPRFGHRGSFPYEAFFVFDCTTTRNGQYCTGARWKSVKASRYGYYTAKRIVAPRCY